MRIILCLPAFCLLYVAGTTLAPQKNIKTSQPSFDCVGMILKNGKPSGACVLVSGKYVLGAATQFVDCDTHTREVKTAKGKITMEVPYNLRVTNISTIQIVFNGKSYNCAKITVHPGALDTAHRGDCSIAIIELKEAPQGITSASLNTAYDELNAKVTLAGYMINNTGLAVKPDNKILTSENMISSFNGTMVKGQKANVVCNFTDAQTGGLNSNIDQVLFRQTKDGWQVLGVSENITYNSNNISKPNYRGENMSWIRVSVFADWIKNNISGN